MKTRKNKKILVAVAMVLMIALVAGMGAMTYSKYITTSKTDSLTATAAKWNYVISANATDLFGTAYKEGTDADTLATLTEDGTVVVKASSTANVVAPGTSGSMTFTVGGESEVLAQFKVSIAATSEIQFDGYYPIKWKFNGNTYNDIAELNDALSTLTAKATWDDVAGAFKFTAATYTISWEWALTEPTDDATKAICMKDTLIGYKAAGADWNDDGGIKVSTLVGATGQTFGDFTTVENYNAIKTEMSFTLTATIEQVQA